MKLPLLSPCLVWCLIGCAAASTGKPIHQFPSSQSLAQIAASSGSSNAPLAPEMASLETYRFEQPPGALASKAPYPDATPWDRMLRDAAIARGVRPTVAMQCLAQQLARVYAESGKAPDFGLHRFLAGRCGAVVGMAETVVWKPELDDAHDLIAAFDAWKASLATEVASHLEGADLEVGFGIARGQGKVMMVLAKATPEAKLEAFSPLIDASSQLVLRGRLTQPSSGLMAHVNEGSVGVRTCDIDAAFSLPEFQITCTVAPGDEAAWVEVASTPPGRVLSHTVLQVLALRTPDAAQEYHRLAWGEPHPVSDDESFRAEVAKLINGVRTREGMRPIRISDSQSKIVSTVVTPFFAALLSEPSEANETLNQITLGLMAGWDLRDGLIRDANLVSVVEVAAPDAASWLSDALDRPSGRLVLLDPEAESLALGAHVQKDPGLLASIAVSYRFFVKEDVVGARAGEVLERLARIRKARGLGATVEVKDLYGMPDALAAIERGQSSPGDAMQDTMETVSMRTGRGVRGLVWETHDLDHIEFPPELLRRGDLLLGAGVTFYRPKGAAWGQYTVIFVVLGDPPNEV